MLLTRISGFIITIQKQLWNRCMENGRVTLFSSFYKVLTCTRSQTTSIYPLPDILSTTVVKDVYYYAGMQTQGTERNDNDQERTIQQSSIGTMIRRIT